jgi:electron transport complex protein RnfC
MELLRERTLPCIRCGDCIAACPAGLDPRLLHLELRAGEDEAALALGLRDCSLCARCDAVCPSAIPLAAQFQSAIATADARLRLLERAASARLRHELRAQRLLRDAEERREAEQALSRQASTPDAVAAALERARAKRNKPGPQA